MNADLKHKIQQNIFILKTSGRNTWASEHSFLFLQKVNKIFKMINWHFVIQMSIAFSNKSGYGVLDNVHKFSIYILCSLFSLLVTCLHNLITSL
jgi:hypothetical protein